MRGVHIENSRVPIAWLIGLAGVSAAGLSSAVALGFYVATVDATARQARGTAIEAKAVAEAASKESSQVDNRLAWIEGVLNGAFPEVAKRMTRAASRTIPGDK